MTDLARLRELAEKATGKYCAFSSGSDVEYVRFCTATNPQTILALLDRLDAAEAQRGTLIEHGLSA